MQRIWRIVPSDETLLARKKTLLFARAEESCGREEQIRRIRRIREIREIRVPPLNLDARMPFT